MTDKPKRGGKREGAGRPKSAKPNKVPYSTKLDHRVVKYLRRCENAAKTIEESLRRNDDFE